MILIFGSLVSLIEAKGYWEKKLQGDINELYRFDFQFSFKYKKLRLFLSLFSCIDAKNIFQVPKVLRKLLNFIVNTNYVRQFFFHIFFSVFMFFQILI